MTDIDRAELEAAYVLHARPYRESSQLLEVLARHHGRIGLVARGARGKKPRWGSALQPFQPLRLSWSGRGTLCTLRSAEPAAPPLRLGADRLMSAFYLNELILAFTTRGDPHPELFAHYTAAVTDLATADFPEPVLRAFEVALLTEIGYGLITDREVAGDVPVTAAGLYEYVPDRGPVPAGQGGGSLQLTGRQLQAIGRAAFDDPVVLRLAKGLLRSVLQHHLGDRELRTRQVLAAMQR
ncbi:MAG: DNA repair protein RecO [Gammaproteobacteria bacterium]|nr:DNA repair protein RecO [Gammaproteobacteria bacterium]